MKTAVIFLAIMLFLFSSAVFVQAAENPLFQAKCAPCHSNDGTGNKKLGILVGGDLSRLDLTKKTTSQKSDRELKETILNGTGKMPAFKEKISKAEADELVKFLRALQKK